VTYDAIIIGGGAAGLFCAITAGKRGRRVLVIEHNAEVGRKIIISGGGRCNFTNLDTRAENFVSQNPHFCKSALSGFTQHDFVRLVEKHRIPYYEKKLGQLFCRENSRAIVEMLLAECRRARVDIRTGCSVDSIVKDQDFETKTSHGSFRASALVVACGGLSFPKVGATDLGYRIARQFGLKIVETRPSLVGLVLQGKSNASLAGVSLDSNVSAAKHTFRENILFTHRGMSGPAILQISNYWQRPDPITVDMLPDTDADGLFREHRHGRRTVANFLGSVLPQRIADLIAAETKLNKPLNQLSDREIQRLADAINRRQVRFSETEGYGRAEVTLGGVSTDEISSKTMGSKKVPGLYFIGEVLDVTGWLGGYNFQWAWSSGFAAGNSI